MKVLSNEQAFLSVYVDHNEEDWRNKIVFIDPIFETLPQAAMVLKSLKYEKYDSAVFSATKNKLLKFKENVMSADSNSEVGKSKSSDIMVFLLEFANEQGLFVSQSSIGNQESLSFAEYEGFIIDSENKFLLEKREGKGYNYLDADYNQGTISHLFALKEARKPNGKFDPKLGFGLSTSLSSLQKIAAEKPITKRVRSLSSLVNSLRPFIELSKKLKSSFKSLYATDNEFVILDDLIQDQVPIVSNYKGDASSTKRELKEDEKKIIELIKDLKWK